MLSAPENYTELIKIGQLQAASGVSIKTIRYYEELGLIKAATRTEGGFRLFSPQTTARLLFIKRSQSLGLSLQEIGELLQIHDQGKLPCEEVKQKLQRKVTKIEQRIKELKLLKTQLSSLIANAESLPQQPAEGVICPIIQQQ